MQLRSDIDPEFETLFKYIKIDKTNQENKKEEF